MSTATPRQMTPAEFLGRFAGLLGEHTSYRLETLDVYHDPSEEDAFRRFRDCGEPVKRTQWWYDHVQQSLRDGKVMTRVHVVSEPLTAYMQFEIAAYLVNGAAAGEDIRILSLRRADALDLPKSDYWLMDSKVAYRERRSRLGAWASRDDLTSAQTAAQRLNGPAARPCGPRLARGPRHPGRRSG